MSSRRALGFLAGAALLAAVVGVGIGWGIRGEAREAAPDYLRSVYSPLHFQPAIATAKDEQCLACHREVLEDRVRPTSPAGMAAASSKAWYQQLSTYAGAQDTFHRRHLVTPWPGN